jgi:NAD(P)-dependent dehydrogenase (short-subunit alcohol dehydrogenase family)
MLTGCILITGCSRGIGLELVRQLARRKDISPKQIIATCRDPQGTAELQDVGAKHPDNVVIKKLDITNYQELQAFAKEIQV